MRFIYFYFSFWKKHWLAFLLILVTCLTLGVLTDLYSEKMVEEPYEVCIRSHIKKIPVIGLDGKKTFVPAERCDEYKIEKTN